MKEINLLDCTLRDGGYVNDWHFGEKAIYHIGKKIVLAGIEYFEIGFVRPCEYDKEYSLFNGNDSVKEMIAPKNPSTHYVGMIDMGRPIPLEQLGKRVPDGFDVFRVIFKKNKIEEAYRYISELVTLGYDVFAQAVGTDNYSDSEFIDLIEKFNELPIQAFYIVDSFGLMKKRDFLRLVQLADNNLREDIMLGYHSHNNMQQAMGNASAFTELNLRRNIILDACVFGMGRGAGNLNLELFAEYMNENFGKHYRIEPMLEIIDEYLNDIYREHFWGYSLPLYLSASNGCHPNYAIDFAARGTLTVKSYHEILKSIPPEDKAVYSKEKAEKFYKAYQENYIDDRKAVEQLEKEFADREILLLGSGKNLQEQKETVLQYIKQNNPLVVGLNFAPEDIPCDYVFVCHMRRYRTISQTPAQKIVTSNVREAGEYDYMLNFSSYAAEPTPIMENSGILCLNFLLHIGILRVSIAGMDGYDTSNRGNYVNSGLEYDFTAKQLEERNRLIGEELEKLGKKMDIQFLTNSIYCEV
jgi:4-hydroxy 2-oxovalerate aldolase